ncbi:Probable poly(glycerol-phosphate) alpha-glucosyltransferase [Arthrobacter agilis]|nr:Probable poly(glycerol-phosphate) alpha-glucosyltransferase [Arthrobacter agilis]
MLHAGTVTHQHVLPEGYHCAVTWGIPFDYGGMTSAMLRRSRAFVTEGGQHVDVLTFDFQPDYPDIACELEVNGELIAGMELRNLWDELRDLPDSDLRRASSASRVKGEFHPIDPGAGETEVFAGERRRRLRYETTGAAVLQIDYLRADGSIFVSDRRDVTERGTEGGRLVTLCDSEGTPLASWNQMWPLYLFWLDVVVSGRETFMIVDSKSTANFITRYRRPNVITMHLVHNSHMAAGEQPPHGELSRVRRYTFERLSSFDAVIFLTAAQKRDVDEVHSSGAPTSVVPNSTELVAFDPGQERDPAVGVMLASLNGRKRVQHAIKALGAARDLGADCSLTVFGDGPDRKKLAQLVEELVLTTSVHLPGFSETARKNLWSASFTLLTSTTEGLPLVLLEAMSGGCLPIAYDIPYGPADLIEDGVNGFLVRQGDIAGVAQSIVKIASSSAEELGVMREAARRTAERFSDSAVTARWGQEMHRAVDRKLEAAVDPS